jgi:hypothetical protein
MTNTWGVTAANTEARFMDWRSLGGRTGGGEGAAYCCDGVPGRMGIAGRIDRAGGRVLVGLDSARKGRNS